jgi:hypothetical protein
MLHEQVTYPRAGEPGSRLSPEGLLGAGEQVGKSREGIEEDFAVAGYAGEDQRSFDLDEGLAGTVFCEAAGQAALAGKGGEGFEPGFVGAGERGGELRGTAAEGEGIEDAGLRAIAVEDAEIAGDGFDAVGWRAGLVKRSEDVGFKPLSNVGSGGEGDVFFASGEAVVEAGFLKAGCGSEVVKAGALVTLLAEELEGFSGEFSVVDPGVRHEGNSTVRSEDL